MTQRNPTLGRGGSKMTQKGPTSFMDVFFKKIITSLPHYNICKLLTYVISLGFLVDLKVNLLKYKSQNLTIIRI